MKSINLYEAKTHLSQLVDEAARGKRIVIAKNGTPRAMLVAIPKRKKLRKPAGALRVTYIAPDFDASDPAVLDVFYGDS